MLEYFIDIWSNDWVVVNVVHILVFLLIVIHWVHIIIIRGSDDLDVIILFLVSLELFILLLLLS
jgi:hypothetical protein